MSILGDLYEENIDKLELKIKRLEAKNKKLEKELEELKKRTGYSTSLAGCRCNNCGHIDRD